MLLIYSIGTHFKQQGALMPYTGASLHSCSRKEVNRSKMASSENVQLEKGTFLLKLWAWQYFGFQTLNKRGEIKTDKTKTRVQILQESIALHE